jgi:hypothetical protein
MYSRVDFYARAIWHPQDAPGLVEAALTAGEIHQKRHCSNLELIAIPQRHYPVEGQSVDERRIGPAQVFNA